MLFISLVIYLEPAPIPLGPREYDNCHYELMEVKKLSYRADYSFWTTHCLSTILQDCDMREQINSMKHKFDIQNVSYESLEVTSSWLACKYLRYSNGSVSLKVK